MIKCIIDNIYFVVGSLKFERYIIYFVYTYHVLFYSITTQFDIENDQSVGNGIPESSPVLEVNVPSTNEHNM